MDKDFDTWSARKKQFNKRTLPPSLVFQEREIWWMSLGINVGQEIDGKHGNFERPVLIVRKFNKNQFLGIPLTSQKRKGRGYASLFLTDSVSWACLYQIRSLSSLRLLRKKGKISHDDFLKIKNEMNLL